jgi:hypothetical protein
VDQSTLSPASGENLDRNLRDFPARQVSAPIYLPRKVSIDLAFFHR